ncbi:MAG: 4Fe-4S dicluster domain-containing protein [bacterium]|nr:4Fe-4S dicluster domain-containing protein [bacterium]
MSHQSDYMLYGQGADNDGAVTMKARTFTGGYIFKTFEAEPRDELVTQNIPSKVVIPLRQGFGSALDPLVKVGDKVRAGQIIGHDQASIASPIHSSINGKVVEIKKTNYFHREVWMVVIEGDGTDDYDLVDGYSSQWEKLPTEAVEKILYTSGVTSLDRQGIPTQFRSSVIGPEKVENIIVHGADSEVYNLSLKLLFKGKGLYNFVVGLKILKKIMPRAKIHVAIDHSESEIHERLSKLLFKEDNIEMVPIVSKYPVGFDQVLIPTILEKSFPYGYSAANIGVVVLNIQAVLQVFEAMHQGKPLIERTIALCGPSVTEPTHVKVRVGTPLADILDGRLKKAPSRVILNSLLTGVELNDLSLPIDRTFSLIIAIPEDTDRKFLALFRTGPRDDSISCTFASAYLNLDKHAGTNKHGEERPCIQCGYCISVCPVRVVPIMLNRLSKRAIDVRLMRYGIFNCIDCNLCSYVCPCKIPLARNIKMGKSKLIGIGCDQSLCILPKFNLTGLAEYRGVIAKR